MVHLKVRSLCNSRFKLVPDRPWRGILAPMVAAVILIMVLVSRTVAQGPLQPSAFTVLHSFTGPPNDGRNPVTGLTFDTAGKLYGTTSLGGDANGGTVFVVTPEGSEAVVHNFTGGPADGGSPSGFAPGADGNFYGTASGGTAGVVFRMSPAGTVTVLYSFAGPPNDGSDPKSGVIQDAQGNLYGTTLNGGAFPCFGGGCGTIFKLSPDGSETVLHSFAGGPVDGASPYGGLLQDAAGNLYGTTYAGGTSGNGVVFKLSPDGTETVLYSFAGPANNGGSSTGPPNDGSGPVAGVIMDGSGNLYGTTLNGGAYSGGTVYQLSPTGTETLLLSLGGPSGDGRSPRAGLVMDAAGNLYGTTSGATNYGGASVFQLSPDGTETVLHNFTGSEGGTTNAGLIQDGGRNLYGTTSGSSASPCSVQGPGGCGIVFKLVPPNGTSRSATWHRQFAASGSVITYIIQVTNHGPDTTFNVNIADLIPAGTTFNSVFVSAGTCTVPAPRGTGTVTCSVPELASGTTITETLVVNVTAGSGSAVTVFADHSPSFHDSPRTMFPTCDLLMPYLRAISARIIPDWRSARISRTWLLTKFGSFIIFAVKSPEALGTAALHVAVRSISREDPALRSRDIGSSRQFDKRIDYSLRLRVRAVSHCRRLGHD